MDGVYDKVRKFLNENDVFCRVNGIKIVSITDECSEARLDITDACLNSRGVVQGGAIFTLMDITFAGLANCRGEVQVAMNASVNYIRPGTGTFLRSVAKRLSRGRRTGVYQIEVFDDQDRLVAVSTITGFTTGERIILES